MRILPRTLFGQLTLTLVAGLLLAQAASVAIHLYDRGITVRQLMGHQVAQRVASVVRLLNDQPIQARPPIIQAFSSPMMRLHIARQPLPQPNEGEFYWREKRIRKHIESLFTPPPQIRVAIRALNKQQQQLVQQQRQRPPGAPHHMRRFGPGADRPFPFTHLIQIELQSGEWAIFEQRVPQSLTERPYRLALSLLVLISIIIFIAWLVVHRLTHPLNHLAQAANRLGRDIESDPLQESGPLEVRRATRAFNTMQQRIRRFIQDRAQFLSAVSHDLKTPLTRMRLRTESIPDLELKERMNRDIEDMESMVNATLDFMRGLDSRETSQPVDINALVDSLCDDYQESGSPITVTGHIEHPYISRPMALKRALDNLISNAVKYGKSPQIQLGGDMDEIRIDILDRGTGIPERDLGRVFDPFFRLESSRNRETGGTGLGLGIARNIIRSQGGDIVLKNRDQGGLKVSVTLPL